MARIKFDCPECGEEMEVGGRMLGKEVECVGCTKMVVVKERTRKPRRVRRERDDSDLDVFSPLEWVLYSLLFFLFPCGNVVVSSILYYVWRNSKPYKASVINALGWIIFGIHVAIAIVRLILSRGR